MIIIISKIIYFMMRYVCFFILLLIGHYGNAQTESQKFKIIYTNPNVAVNLTSSGDSYGFMALRQHLGALNEIIKQTKDEQLILKQINLIDNLITSATRSDKIANSTYELKDSFQAWTAKQPANIINTEVPLFESYSFFYVAEFLHLLKVNGWVNKSEKNRMWWNRTVRFLEHDIWTKWRSRSYRTNKMYNQIFLRSRTHMGSHWAGIALYLREISNNDSIKVQATELISQYDRLLRRNLELRNGAYVWNSTYNDVTGTDAIRSAEVIVQDVSHGNHVISYVISAYELGNKNWRLDDLNRFSKTLTMLYDGAANAFADNVDGSADPSRPGWGNFVGDGWVKLGRYNREAAGVLLKFSRNKKLLKRYYQTLQFNTTILPYTK